jgi:hypothetical protein
MYTPRLGEENDRRAVIEGEDAFFLGYTPSDLFLLAYRNDWGEFWGFEGENFPLTDLDKTLHGRNQ